jgi:hypothetical protein
MVHCSDATQSGASAPTLRASNCTTSSADCTGCFGENASKLGMSGNAAVWPPCSAAASPPRRARPPGLRTASLVQSAATAVPAATLPDDLIAQPKLDGRRSSDGCAGFLHSVDECLAKVFRNIRGVRQIERDDRGFRQRMQQRGRMHPRTAVHGSCRPCDAHREPKAGGECRPAGDAATHGGLSFHESLSARPSGASGRRYSCIYPIRRPAANMIGPSSFLCQASTSTSGRSSPSDNSVCHTPFSS